MKRALPTLFFLGCASSLPFAPPSARAVHPTLRSATTDSNANDLDAAYGPGRPPIELTAPSSPPKILEATTKNGVRVLGFERRDLPLVSFGIVMKNAAPDAAPAGFRSLLLNTLRRGTKDAERGDIYARFTELAIEWDASTVADRGAYFELKAVRPLALVAFGTALDMFGEPGLRKEDFTDALDYATAWQKKRDRSTRTVAIDAALDRLFPRSASFRSADADAIGKVTLADVSNFAHRALTADNVVVTAAGDFDWPKVLEHVEDGLGRLPRGAVAWPAPEQTASAGVRLVPWRASQPTVVLGFRGPATNHPDRAAMNLVDEAISGFLFRSLRVTHGITYGSSVHLYPGRDMPPLLITTSVEAGGVKKAIDGVFEAIAKVQTLSDDDVARSRTLARASLVDSLGTVSDAVGTLAWFGANDLPVSWYSSRSAELEKVTAADLARVARTYLKRETMQVVVVGDVSGIEAELGGALGPVETRREEPMASP